MNNPGMEKKIKVGVIFGGRSAEHEVSLVSATSVMNALDRTKYEVIPIGITPQGKWLTSHDALKLLKEKSQVDRYPEHTIVPNPNRKGLVSLNSSLTAPALYPLDVVIPVLHGTFGEDGTIQGLLELAGIPFVGAGVLGSAVGMDKVVQKHLLEHAGIPVTPGISFIAPEFTHNEKKILVSIERKLRYPCFVKPANLGSSIGISKAHNRKELRAAIVLAAEYDRKILVEKAVVKAREIECSVLGNDDPQASVLGEIISSNEFYDYNAKYVDGKSTAVIPAKLPKSIAVKIRECAATAFRVLECAGMARVDFLVSPSGAKYFLSEINTLPGFTSISMFPKLWEASGVPYGELLNRLIQLALERHAQKAALRTMYQPGSNWFKQ